VNELFNIPMNDIMVALLILLGVALGSVGWVILRNRVMFLVGIRNIPRRRAQTILIVVGLMLSTLIISAAFSIGDTVSYSITNQGYAHLGYVDETVQAQTGTSGGDFVGVNSVASPRPIPQNKADQFTAAFRKIDGVDGAVPVLRGVVPIIDERSGQSERSAVIAASDPAQMQGFPGIVSTSGKQLPLSDLGPDELYLNSSLADKLDAQVGDKVTVFVSGKPSSFTVKGIVEDRVLTGTVFGQTQGMAMTLEQAQTLFNRPDQVDLIAVSNNGGIRDGVHNSDAVTKALNKALAENGGSQWKADDTKQSLVHQAELGASFLTTFFVVLGLFSIAAGMLLIFLIFVMLAAERKVEMGMVRAVGTKRSHLMQMFMSEGMAYNVMAAAVGCGLGIAVSLIMVRIMAALFSAFDLSIIFHVSPRSLIVSYSLGVVLTFLTVTFSSWRVGALNIVSAIRDMPESFVAEKRPRFGGGLRGVLHYVRWLFVKPASLRGWLRGIGLVALAAPLIFVTVAFVMGAIALGTDTLAAGAGAVLLMVFAFIAGAAALVFALIGLNSLFRPAPPLLVGGVLLAIVGIASSQGFPYMLGATLIVVSLAMFAQSFGMPARPAFTAMGLILVAYWLLGAGDRLPFPPHNMKGGIEMFFLSGVAMVTALTFVLIYNADLMLGALTLTGGLFSRLTPSIKTAVAYPLANKFRTGMTIAMISLVVFALVMMSTMNANFNRIFLSDAALGGYDVQVTQNPNNPITDLKATLQQRGFDTSKITEVDSLKVANSRVALVHQAGESTEGDNEGFAQYPIFGMSPSFVEHNGLELQARANGFSDDAAVWQSIAQHPDQVVIDAAAIGDNGGFSFNGGDFSLSGVASKDKTFAPITLQLRDGATGTTRDVQVVGIIATKASELFNGIFVPEQTFDSVFTQPETTVDFVKLAPGTNAQDTARGIEKALLLDGVQADSLRKIIDDNQALSRGFSYLIQGFMGMGLFVGIAAVGVIAFRTVVERRQQIGMLRAIGYTRAAVALSFVMESSFIALLGVVGGIGLGILLANQLLTSPGMEGQGIEGFYVPWIEIIGIGVFAFVASLIMTIIPSRQASSIPIAEALRYE